MVTPQVTPMAETLMLFQTVLVGTDGRAYVPRACGAPNAVGTWEGWIEFVPQQDGPTLRSPRETTQPKFSDAVYWASGLSPAYLEGALDRATCHAGGADHEREAPDAPAGGSRPPPPSRASVLDPFAVAEKGHAHLRRQLGALSPWHLVNVVRTHDLSHASDEALLRLSQDALIDTIVMEVIRRERTANGRDGA
jgi:hypothetical protein